MLRKLKKHIAILLTIFFLIIQAPVKPVFAASRWKSDSSQTVTNISLIQLTEKYVNISDGKFYITDNDALRYELEKNWSDISEDIDSMISVDDYISALENRFELLNEMSTQGIINIARDGQIYDSQYGKTYTPFEYGGSGRSFDKVTKYYWWGVRHTFYTDDSARDYAYDVRMAAHKAAAAAAIHAVLFEGVGAVPAGLTAVYAYSLADTVDYNTNKAGDGVILEIQWILTYDCYPR